MAFYRNFGGKLNDSEKWFQIIDVAFENQLISKANKIKFNIESLIKDNISDKLSRHLMLITDNEDLCIQFMEDKCTEAK